MPFAFPPEANARVITVAGKRCRLALRSGESVEAIARGRLFREEGEQLVVGDHVVAERHGEQWMVEKVFERQSVFVREGLRRERQVLFSNADRVLLLASLANPTTKTAAIDRFLAAALHGGVPPVLVLTKTDLDEDARRAREISDLYAAFDLPVFSLSNVTGDGVTELAQTLGDGISACVGNSGVGKTSLLNRLIPGLDLRIRDISAWSGKGTHTTSAALLLPYGERAALMDTPGMKSFVPFGVTRESVIEIFPEIARFAEDCRFRDCRHVSEPDCAVLAAAAGGELAAARLRSYHRLLEIASGK
ncbi:MAG: ribosome small subunit-dependent GTPase A [bacterium]|nr:ribosome small subunit-dependent GTPase A [bacterium]